MKDDLFHRLEALSRDMSRFQSYVTFVEARDKLKEIVTEEKRRLMLASVKGS